VAAGVVVVGATMAGCGGGGGGPAVVSSSPVVVVTSELGPDPTVPDDTTAADGAGGDSAEGQIDAAAAAHGWDYQDYDDAAGLVQDVCDTLDDDSADPDVGFSLGQWLGTYGWNPGERKLISFGVPLLCSQWKATVASAWAGTYPVWMDAGTWKVTSKPGDDHVPPGTYRVVGDISDCYWERATAGGDIIDNRFITAATRVTVTIRASDDLFTTRDCGVWKPVH
jgi:hypothetical protein